MSRRVVWNVLLTFFLVALFGSEVAPAQDAGAADESKAGEAQTSELAPRLPVEAFFGDLKFSHPRLAPDGRHVAFLYSEGDAQAIAVQPTAGGDFLFLGKIEDPELRLAWLEWVNSQRILLSVQMRSYDSVAVKSRTHKLVSVALDDDKLRKLGLSWPGRVQFEDRVLHFLPDDPRNVLLTYHPSNKEFPQAMRLDVKSGALAPVEAAETGVDVWHADHDGNVRAGEGFDGLLYSLVARAEPDGKLKQVIEWNPYEEDGFYFAGFSYDPKKIYVAKDTGGTVGIVEYDLTTQTLGDVVFSDPEYDAGDLVFDRKLRKLVAVKYLTDEPTRRFLDVEAAKEQSAIDRAMPDTYNEFISRSDDRSLQIVRVSSDVMAPEYYGLTSVDGQRQLKFMLALYPDLVGQDLPPMRAMSYTARDGLEIPAYLTVPKGMEAKNLPVIVLPHGGPTARDVRRFDPEVQLFANRGFAVFQMNFRGSSGYGDHFRALGFRQWGGTMQDDVTDGVRWLIEQGIADPDRIGIYGGSYGGYAALMGLATTPELFRAGASFAGVTDLPLLLGKSRWYRFHEHNRPTIGGGWDDRKRLNETSPVHLANQIRVPVLLAHGVDDDRVDVKHSRRMEKALRKAGRDVEYLEFEDEPHGFLLEKNRLRFYSRLVEFFEEHLAPRAANQQHS